MAGTLYRVTAPAAVIRNRDKGERYLYAGSVFTAESVRDGEVNRMLELGFIEFAADLPEPAGEPAGPAPAAGLEGLTVQELRKLAGERGVTAPKGATKAVLIEGLKHAERFPEPDVSDLTVDQLLAKAAARGIDVPEGVTDPADLVAILEQ